MPTMGSFMRDACLERRKLVAISTTGRCEPTTSLEFERQGGTAMIHTDVRAICAACPNVVEKSRFGHL